ncbi:hypothetical protein HSRCO_2575 [Halanaeroarchaeum sp. HSR-CO]|uniref:hypothetical protein n=1 Tax=Halanaeroarchaeum sp. HSR-CO TaxID=2866382 RepID=UPI00217EC3C4|nr:hypothetical protein [Halanaeroarchaeum sp. HSR-CO]UWG48837.1 hypothetical protein HSRCO_2575 [Halanaeroarchaeum sp. HSR-CO]
MPDDDWRFGFRLPPFRLPEFFPDDFEVVLPVPGRFRGRPVGTRWVLAVALLVDLVDALLVLTVVGPALLARSFVVFVISLAVAGAVGLVAVWELVAVLIGYQALTLVPSVTVLVVVRARYTDVDA